MFSSKKYITWFSLITVVIISAICTTNYIVDPFMRYRIKDGKYLLNPRFVNPGLLKNYDYDLLVIGSSMVQLLDMDMLRKKMPSKPLKAASGDMNIKELELIYSLAKKEKVNTFIINLDLHKFYQVDEENRYSEYLYKDGIINDLKYLLSYETNRLTPIDIFVSKYLENEKHISSKFYYRTQIDKIGDFGLDLNYAFYNVRKAFCKREIPDTTNIYDRMRLRFDNFLFTMEFEKYKDKEFILFLPPYSAAYWYASKIDGYDQEMIRFLKYILNKVDNYENVRVVCLFDSDFITDVDTYADMVHYSPVRTEFIIDAITDKSKDITLSNFEVRISKLDSLVSQFEANNAIRLKCD